MYIFAGLKCLRSDIMTKSAKLDFKYIKMHARELRLNMTESEKLVWNEIKNRKLSGFKFLRQHPIIYKGDLSRLHYFIADFYCYEKKLILEIDGPIHDTKQEYDKFRDSELKSLGMHILRIKNEELVNIKEILQKILTHLNSID
jgi:very-short-patch-repair endonuclease